MKKALVMFSGILSVICAGHILAEPTQERVALMLSGQDCPSLHRIIAETLQREPGVRRVDLNVIPDHVMIDRVPGQLSPEDFAARVNALAPPGASCRAEVMKSCITADVAIHHEPASR